MVDHLRFVSPTDRILHIKSLPMWQDLTAGDVLPLALAAREEHFEPGEVLLQATRPAANALLLVDGRVLIRSTDAPDAIVTPPHGVGFLSVLNREALGVDVIADAPVIALRIAREDLQRAHEDNFHLFERCLRQIASLAADDRPSLMPFAVLPDDPRRGPSTHRAAPRVIAEGAKDFAERLLWLSEIDPFRSASLESVAEITRRQSPWTVGEGEVIWRAGEPSSFFLGLVDGAIRCELPGLPAGMPVRSDWLVGLVDALAERPRSCRLVAASPSTLLRMDTEALLGVLEDDPALRISLLEVLATRAVGAGPTCLTGTQGDQPVAVPSWGRSGLPSAAALGGWKPPFP